MIIGLAITIASCSNPGSGSSTTTGATTTVAAAVSSSASSAPATTTAAATTTSAVPTTTAAPTTTTVAATSIRHGELWDVVDGAALLTAADGSTMRGSFGRAQPIRGQSNGVDLDAVATAANIQGDASFQAERTHLTSFRSVQMWLASSAEGATALLAAAGPQFDESSNPTPLATAIEGAMAFEYGGANDVRKVQLSFARGPVFVVVDIVPWAGEPTEVNLATAESVARATVGRIEARLATCATPCTGVAGGAPTWPKDVETKRPVGTCEVFAWTGPDFRPPPTSRVDVPCTEEHDVEYVATITFPRLEQLPRIGMPTNEVTAAMQSAAFDLLFACNDATKAVREARGLEISYSRAVKPTPEQIAAGDQEVVCALDATQLNLPRIPGVPA